MLIKVLVKATFYSGSNLIEFGMTGTAYKGGVHKNHYVNFPLIHDVFMTPNNDLNLFETTTFCIIQMTTAF